jgi:hypothetical protein
MKRFALNIAGLMVAIVAVLFALPRILIGRGTSPQC